VKLAVLTARGIKARDEILRAFHEPPLELLTLDRRDLTALETILAKVAPQASPLSPAAYSAQLTRRRPGPRRSSTRGRVDSAHRNSRR
jgi:hypothetical protein